MKPSPLLSSSNSKLDEMDYEEKLIRYKLLLEKVRFIGLTTNFYCWVSFINSNFFSNAQFCTGDGKVLIEPIIRSYFVQKKNFFLRDFLSSVKSLNKKAWVFVEEMKFSFEFTPLEFPEIEEGSCFLFFVLFSFFFFENPKPCFNYYLCSN